MEGFKKFSMRDLIGSLIIVVIGIVLTFFIGWMVSVFLTTIIAFFFLRFIGSSQKERESTKGLCKFCRGELTWISQHSRYYCHNCQKYPPTCSTCGKDLFWIPRYNRLFCNSCQRYEDVQKENKSKKKSRTGRVKGLNS